jgi:hypothetical protein
MAIKIKHSTIPAKGLVGSFVRHVFQDRRSVFAMIVPGLGTLGTDLQFRTKEGLVS